MDEDHVIGRCEGNACRVPRNLLMAEACSQVLWKVERLSNELGYFTEEIPKQRVGGLAWCFLTVVECEKRETETEDGTVQQKSHPNLKIWKLRGLPIHAARGGTAFHCAMWLRGAHAAGRECCTHFINQKLLFRDEVP